MATKEMLDDDYFDDDKYDDEDNEREPRSTQPYNSSKIFIGNLPFTILKSDLEYMFGSVSIFTFVYFISILFL